MSLERAKSIEAGLQTILPNKLELEETEPTNEKSPKIPFCAQIRLIATNITVEPVLICYILPNVMSSIATQNLSLEKSCRVNLGFDKNVCDALSARNETAYPNYKVDEEAVQTLAATMAIYKNIIQAILPALLLLFLGSWSDRNQRRKPCIINPIIGDIFTCAGFLIATYFFYQLPIEFNVFVEAVPSAMTGAWFSMFLGVFSYVSGISSAQTRTLRIGAVHMIFNISFCVGIALSGILYQKIGFYGVYSLACLMYVLGLLYTCCFVKEIPKSKSVEELQKTGRKKGFIRDFFDVKHVSNTLVVAFKTGERNRRARICCIMVLVMIIIGPIYGEINVTYYLVRYKYGWDSIDYSLFSTFQFVLSMFGTFFSLMFFSKFLKLNDAILGMISAISKISAMIMFAFAPNSFWFYMGAVLEVFGGTSFIALRSIVSKLVPPNELGKINSLFGVCEAIVPLVYGPLYSKVYALTIKTFPSVFFLIGAGLLTPGVFIFLWLHFEHMKDVKEDKKLKSQKEKLLETVVKEQDDKGLKT